MLRCDTFLVACASLHSQYELIRTPSISEYWSAKLNDPFRRQIATLTIQQRDPILVISTRDHRKRISLLKYVTKQWYSVTNTYKHKTFDSIMINLFVRVGVTSSSSDLVKWHNKC